MAQKYPAKLMFDRPADDFRESFVLGNGRIGASVFGNLKRERILLNETSLNLICFLIVSPPTPDSFASPKMMKS